MREWFTPFPKADFSPKGLAELAMLQVEGLTVGQGQRTLITDLTFELGANQILCVLGPNGSGKTTLVRTLLGLHTAEKGTIVIYGQDQSKLDQRTLARLISWLPQEESAVYPFTAKQVVLGGVRPWDDRFWDTPDDDQAALNALEKVGATSFADRIVSSLSGGEKQRVLVARLLAQETPVIVLDEPVAQQDPSQTQAIAQTLRQLSAEGKAILAVVHDLNLALALSDQILVLDGSGGWVLGSPGEILEAGVLEKVFGISLERIRLKDGTEQVVSTI